MTRSLLPPAALRKERGLEWLEKLNHKIEDPVPSLFTFNMPDESVTELMGVSVEKASVSIEGTTLKSEGPLLITHWGMIFQFLTHGGR